MKILKKLPIWLYTFGIMAAGVACSGTSDEADQTRTPTLIPTEYTLIADGTDVVTFTVQAGSIDVTAQSVIHCVTTGKQLSSPSFSTTTAGSYVFEAVYQNRTSPQVTIDAREAEKPFESQYVRKTCVMEFTGQWCAICPKGASYLSSLLNLNYNTDGDTKAYVIALHSKSGGGDDLHLAVTDEIASAYNKPSFPAYVVDLRAQGTLGETPLRAQLTTDLNESLGYTDRDDDGNKFNVPSKYPAHCGIAIKSVFDESTKTASVNIRVAAEQTERYRIALWVVEDNIRGKQNNAGIYEENFLHRHVARQLVSASYKGDLIGDIQAGTERDKTYSFIVDDAWNLDNTALYALAIDADGYVNNVAECAIVNGNTDYDKVKK